MDTLWWIKFLTVAGSEKSITEATRTNWELQYGTQSSKQHGEWNWKWRNHQKRTGDKAAKDDNRKIRRHCLWYYLRLWQKHKGKTILWCGRWSFSSELCREHWWFFDNIRTLGFARIRWFHGPINQLWLPMVGLLVLRTA